MKYAFVFVRWREITTFSFNEYNHQTPTQTNPRGLSPGDVKAVSRILLSRRTSTIDLRNLPSSIGRVALKHWFTWSCSRKVFLSRAVTQHAGGLLPHLLTLACARRPSAV